MKKFVLLTVGFSEPNEEMMKAWMEWFGSIREKIVEQVGLWNGREVTEDEVTALAMDKDAITGYLVIHAESIEEAQDIAKACPMITSTKVYEVR